MMKKLSYFLQSLVFILLVVLTGCKDEEWNKGTSESKDGYGTLSFIDLNVEVANIDAVDSRNVPEVGSFIVEIFRDGNLYMSFPYVSTMPESVSLPVGTYTVKARSGDVLAAAWYSPYFEGQTTVTIQEDNVSKVQTVICKLANIKVTVVIEGKLRDMIDEGSYVNVAYRNQEDRSKILTYGLDAIDESHEGYFEYIPGGETLVAVLHGTIDGEEFRKEFPCVNLSAGQHCVVTFSIKEDPGNSEDPGNEDPGTDNPGTDNPGNDDGPGEDNPGSGDSPGDDDDPGNDDPGNGENPGDDEPDDPQLPEIDETIGSFTLENGLTINVSIRIIDLTFTLPGEEDPALGGILRPGDPGYTGDEEPSAGNPSYPWDDPDDNKGDDNQGSDSPEDPNPPVNPDPEDPGSDDPEQPEEPVAHTVGFDSKYLDLKNANPAEEFGTEIGQKPAILEIFGTAGIAHIYVKIDSPALPPEELRGIGLTSEFDLAYPGDYENGLKELGFVTGAEVIGKTTVNFDATEFIPLLIILNTPGTHHFYITVVDQQENPLSETLDLRFVTE